MAMSEGGVGVDVLAVMEDGTTSMYWVGRAAYQSGLTLTANPWDGEDPSQARANWSWRKGFASAECAALARIGGGA